MLNSDVVELVIRQQPVQAVVTPENKEKMRKPIDPPPIVQLTVSQHHDPGSHFLVNPFLFMAAILVDARTFRPIRPNALFGGTASSLHRLKDPRDNKDGGFFVLGDISCRREGRFRLQFALFEMESGGTWSYVEQVVSEPFMVMPVKSFRGLQESSTLSRTFSDQGVRLRLRKEARVLAGAKRSYTGTSMGPPTPPGFQSGSGAHQQRQDYDYPKRQRTDSEINPHMADQQMYSFPPPHQAQQSYFESSANSVHNGYAQGTYYPGQMTPTTTMTQSSMQPAAPSAYPSSTYSASQGFSSATAAGLTLSTPVGDRYSNQQSNLYGGRPSGDTYGINNGLRTPTSASDSGIGYQDPQNAVSFGSNATVQSSRSSLGQLMSASVPQTSTLPNLASSYGMPSASYQPSTYSSAADSVNSAYYHTTPQTASKYEPDVYGGSTNSYFESSRSTYPGGGSSLSETNLSLGPSLLDRSYAPVSLPPQQQTPGGGMPEQDLSGYKSNAQAYPTPNQTGPLS